MVIATNVDMLARVQSALLVCEYEADLSSLYVYNYKLLDL